MESPRERVEKVANSCSIRRIEIVMTCFSSATEERTKNDFMAANAVRKVNGP
jgi:hypothetical protein